jgi:hypothetical protein
MTVTLTDADIESIVSFHADKGVPLAPALMARMSGEQLDMAARIMREAAERHAAHAEELERFKRSEEAVKEGKRR